MDPPCGLRRDDLPGAVGLTACGAVAFLGVAPDRDLLLELAARAAVLGMAFARAGHRTRRRSVVPGDGVVDRGRGGFDDRLLVGAHLFLVEPRGKCKFPSREAEETPCGRVVVEIGI